MGNGSLVDMTIPLEDDFHDILAKAQRGLGWTSEELARQAGVTESECRAALAGRFDERVVRRLAGPLGLGADALAAIGQQAWNPGDLGAIPGVAMFRTPFGGMTVNAFLVWDEQTRQAAAFDTSGDCRAMLELAGVRIELIFLTHGHRDHVGDLDRLVRATRARAYAGRAEEIAGAEPMDEGRMFVLGELRIEARQTNGHSPAGMSYVVTGLSRSLVVVGDALFAGSIGGGLVSYQDALRNNREKILTLPDETVVAPGHGPLTTVGQEKRHNPFFPGFLCP